jgi:hypothetical protein
MAAELEHPRQASDLYIVLGAPVDPYRPYMTGDVFQGIAIPGVEDAESEEAAEQLAMITTHPCSMRDGAKLKSHVEVRRVVKWGQIPLQGWATASTGILPLPELREDNPDQNYAVVFELVGRIRTDGLDHSSRIACLSEEGVAYLYQRLVRNTTRFTPPMRSLSEVSEPVFLEAELQEDWNRAFLKGPPADVLPDALLRQADAFDELLSEEHSVRQGKKTTRYTIREDLKRPDRRAAVRRKVKERIREVVTGQLEGEAEKPEAGGPEPDKAEASIDSSRPEDKPAQGNSSGETDL